MNMQQRLTSRLNMVQKGFTLIEVMVVIVILAILASVVATNVMSQNDKAHIKTTQQALVTTAAALDLFKLDNARYPSTQEGLDALVHKPANVKEWPDGGYVKGGMPQDAWGNDLQYVSPGSDGKPYDLYSFGADGKEGGEGNDADIYLKQQ